MKYSALKKNFYLALLALAACSGTESYEVQQFDVYEDLEFEMPKVIGPVFSDLTVSLKEFGAVPGGQTINTQAFEQAIAHVAKNGGGQVIVPRGIWLTGPIVLKSNINLHVEEGALVLFSDNKDLYPLVETSFEGLNTVRCQSPVSARDVENIAITGKGVFDGSGDAWRQVKRSKLTGLQWGDVVASGGVVDEEGENWYPSEEFKKGAEISDMNVPAHFTKLEDYYEIKDFLRPVMVSLVKCNKVLLDGPVFQNSPAWNIHPLMCRNLTVRNIRVRNPWYSQNGDGIDIESCKNTVLYNSTFDVGDDAICIKSGKDKDGRDRGVPTENLIVKNCIVYHGHGGVTVGSEMSGGVKNMHVSGCTFLGTDVGLRFKSTRGRGGVVEGIYISDIDMIDIPTNAISFNMYYSGLSVSEMLASKKGQIMNEAHEVTEETPQFKDISIKNVTCKGAFQAIYLQGLPEMNLENVLLENLTMEAENGLFCTDANGITINNMNLIASNFPALKFYNAKNVKVTGVAVNENGQPVMSVNGEETRAITIELKRDKALGNYLVVDKRVKKDEVDIIKN